MPFTVQRSIGLNVPLAHSIGLWKSHLNFFTISAESSGSLVYFSRFSLVSQLSTLEPPLLAIIRPTGTPVARVMVFAKKYPAALASPTVAGQHCFHSQSASSSGVMLITPGIFTKCISESALAPATTSLYPSTGQLSKPFMGISMLLCPAQTHTSPASTFLTVTAPSPSSKLMDSLRPSALGDFTVSCHFPWASALAL